MASMGMRMGTILEKKEAPPVPLMVPDFLWFWLLTASPVPITCRIQGGLWQKSSLREDGEVPFRCADPGSRGTCQVWRYAAFAKGMNIKSR